MGSGLGGELDDLVAHAAGGAGDQDRLAGLQVGGVDRCDRGRPGQAERGAGDEVDRLGQGGDADRGRDGDVLGEGAVAQVGLGDGTEDPVADLVVGHAGADGVDGAGEVLAQDDREPVLHHVLAGSCWRPRCRSR